MLTHYIIPTFSLSLWEILGSDKLNGFETKKSSSSRVHQCKNTASQSTNALSSKRPSGCSEFKQLNLLDLIQHGRPSTLFETT